MSAAILVFLKNATLPTVDAWNAAIKAHGFPLVLDPFDPRTDSCYRPALLQDRESGFEWYLSPLAERTEERGFPIKAHVGDCDLEADLSYSTQADENVAACVAGAVLAAMTGGFYLDPEYGHNILNGEQALAVARKTVSDWQRYGPWQGYKPVAPEPPPVIAPNAPPPINLGHFPPVRADIEPPLPPMNPRKFLFYRLACGFMVLIYLGMALNFILIARGDANPPLSIPAMVLTAGDPDARAAVVAKKRADAPGTAAFCGAIALFYCTAAFVPRKPWGWTLGRIAIIAMFFPFIITLALTIPLLNFWQRPETQRAFAK